jgi:hypothetical protein
MDKNKCFKGLRYQINGRLWGWSLMMICGKTGASTAATMYILGIKGAYQYPALRYIGGTWGQIRCATATGDITRDMGRVTVGGDSSWTKTGGR